ncbi:FGGY-family carbohydrate kinase [Aestuariivirga litoralis]|uniref:FGGY-family carbohydrate kinase n=1 Tax=Aestuariivirga litoralis TaxID=2650924 RepID=UPI0018C7FB1E|nr:FGGY-family carbohydrate kinase [Aestuariivirga litoralis]MBG1233402.1 FGGY-family carbohydrate kinase [Aestuariivirga litoralis]
MSLYLGIDIGTFESKGVLVDGSGEIVATAAHQHKMLVPQPGWAEHDAEADWWGDFKRLTQSLLAQSNADPKSIKAIGASAIGPCMLPVDKAGNPLMNGVLYGVDTRAAEEIRALTAEYGEAVLLSETGNALTSQSVGPKIQWLKNKRPELYAKADKFITSTTFIVHRLTGKHVIDHYSAGSWQPLYSPAEEKWSPRFAKGICSQDKLADVMWTTEIAGEVTAKAAAETGLAAGTPVIAGTIDAAAEAVSVGVLAPGQMMLMYGSTIFIILVTAARGQDARLWYAPWLFPGQHASMSGLATSGTLTHWFRDQFSHEFTDAKQGAIALAQEAALSPPGAKGLVALPYFSGERTPIHDPDAKGMIFGLNLTHTRGDVYRSLLEGIGHGTRHVMETYANAGQQVSHIEAVGGGTNNDVWLQATSDIGGFAQAVRAKTMGASYGDAFLAALGVGAVKASDINEWNKAARNVAPNPAVKPLYDRQHATFRALYERNRDLMRSV